MNSYKSIIRVLSLANIAAQWNVEAQSRVAFSLEDTCHVPLVQKAKGVEHDRDLSFNEFIDFLQQYHHANQIEAEWNDSLVRSFTRPTFLRLSTIYCTNLLKASEQCNGSKVIIPRSLHDRGKNSTSIMTKEENLYIFSVCEEGFRSLDMIESPSFNGIVTLTIYTPKAIDEWIKTLSEGWRQICFDTANDLSVDGNVYNLHETYVENYEKGTSSCDEEYRRQLEKDLLISDNDINCYRVTLYAHIVLSKSFNANDSSRIFFDKIDDKLRAIDVLDECDSADDCIFKRFYDHKSVSIGSEEKIIVSIGFVLTVGIVFARFFYNKREKDFSGSKLDSFPLTIPCLVFDDEEILKEGGNHSVYIDSVDNFDNCEGKSDSLERIGEIITGIVSTANGNGNECNCSDIEQDFQDHGKVEENGSDHGSNISDSPTATLEKHCRSVSLISGGF